MKEEPTRVRSTFSALAVKGLLVFGTLLLCLVMLELGLRAIGRYRSDGVEGFHAPAGISYGLKTNFTKRIFKPRMSFSVHTCELGFRAKQPGPRPLGKRPYYAVLGSSEVFGNGLDYEQTFIGVFARNMEAQGIDVVNMAVDGHHLLEQISIFKQFLALGRPPPKVVLICVNPLFIGGYDDIHENVTVRMGELFPRNNWRVPLAKMVLSNVSGTYCFLRDSIRNIQLRYFSRKDFSLAFYLERYSTRHRIRSPERSADFIKQLKALEDDIRALNATPVCVYFPAVGGFLLNDLKAKGQLGGEPFDTSYFPDLMKRHCESEGIQFVNLEPTLQVLYDKGEKLNFDLDAHFNGPTSRVIGDYLYNALSPALRQESRNANLVR